MALTVAVVKRNVNGATREAVVDLTFPNPYVSGGISFTTADVDPSQAAAGAFTFVSSGSSTVPAGYTVYYDYTNKKMMAFVITTGVEAGAIDLSLVVVRVLVRYAQASG